MTKKLLALSVCLLFTASMVAAAPQAADEVKLPVLQAARQIMNGDKPQTVGSAPEVVDWNNDGKKDLIIGQFSEGKIRVYMNGGTDSAPVFAEFSYLQADGRPIRLEAG